VVTKVEKPVETRAQALHRLASEARKRGIAIHVYDLGVSPEYFATSQSRPGTLHRVTLLSCDCAGFMRNQRCTHHARLLDEVGELPPVDPEPTPIVAAIKPLSTTTAVKTPSPAELPGYLAARVARAAQYPSYGLALKRLEREDAAAAVSGGLVEGIFPANYPGTCARTGRTIHPSDLIQRAAGGWALALAA